MKAHLRRHEVTSIRWIRTSHREQRYAPRQSNILFIWVEPRIWKGRNVKQVSLLPAYVHSKSSGSRYTAFQMASQEMLCSKSLMKKAVKEVASDRWCIMYIIYETWGRGVH
jgi:hypothetical protein